MGTLNTGFATSAMKALWRKAMTLKEAVMMIQKKMDSINYDGKVTLNIEINIIRYPFINNDEDVRLAFNINSIYRGPTIDAAVAQYLSGQIDMQLLFEAGEKIDVNNIDNNIQIKYPRQLN